MARFHIDGGPLGFGGGRPRGLSSFPFSEEGEFVGPSCWVRMCHLKSGRTNQWQQSFGLLR